MIGLILYFLFGFWIGLVVLILWLIIILIIQDLQNNNHLKHNIKKYSEDTRPRKDYWEKGLNSHNKSISKTKQYQEGSYSKEEWNK